MFLKTVSRIIDKCPKNYRGTLSGALACLGHEIVAAIIGGSTIVSLTATFVAGKISQKR
jgi:hypothetical protein